MHALKTYLMQHSNMPFVDFMQMALYAPLTGYYNTNSEKLGRGGDFITAPELTPLFGNTIATQCKQVFEVLKNPIILEFGAGTGQLCVDILTHLERTNCLPKQYLILEVSAGLKLAQQKLISEKIAHLAPLVHWLDSLPETPFQGVLLANEVLDAMPVHRFMQTKDGLLESYISLNDTGALQEDFLPCTNQRLQAHVEKVLIDAPLPYISEANLFIDAWIRSAALLLEKGAFFMLDYGFPRHEYYHPDRHLGTIMCHYQHKSHNNFLAHPH
jgi:SAM-dependent MidA family methyltransferase